MERIAAIQSSLAKQIKQAFDSYNNLAEERKNAKLVQEKLTKLEENWQLFEENDNTIRNQFSDRVDHFYFTEELYPQAEALYNTFKQSLLHKMQGVGSPVVQIPPAPPQPSVSSDTYTAPGPATSQQIPQPEVQQNPEQFLQPLQPPRSTESVENTSQNSPIEAFDFDQATIKGLMRKLNARKGMLKRFIESVHTSGQTIQYYEVKLERLKSYWAAVENYIQELLSQADDPSAYGYDADELFALDETTQELMMVLTHKIKSGGLSIGQLPNSGPSNKIKLPPITIPKFNGDYLKWPQFHDLFMRTIHSKPLGDVEKMWYLKSNLEGEAATLLQHLTLTDNNYSIAWTTLSERYSNERLLVSSVLDKLFKVQIMKSASAQALKTLHDTVRECVLLLENLELKVKGSWDPILLYVLIRKLDRETHSLYELSLKDPKKLQTLEDFLKFIELRFQSLESLSSEKAITKIAPKANQAAAFVTNNNNNGTASRCTLCNKDHPIYMCGKFLALMPQERTKQAQKLQLCINCLRSGHHKTDCQSRGCKQCNQKHNTLLHYTTKRDQGSNAQSANATPAPAYQKSSPSVHQTNSANIATPKKELSEEYVFLGTALASVMDKHGEAIKCRILLDSGSQLNFISERLQRKLKLDAYDHALNISGIGNSQLNSKDRVNITIASLINSYNTTVEAQVINQITIAQPQRFVDISSWPIPGNISLADPEFNKPQRVDILLGAELYSELMRMGQIKMQPKLPMLQNTIFGWVVLGKAAPQEAPNSFVGISNQELDSSLKRFWEIDDTSSAKTTMSSAEIKCENFFKNTTAREGDGRFTVNLPIVSDTALLGESMNIAVRRFINIEKRLYKAPELRQQYIAFMEEYERLGHMTEISALEIPQVHYFLPHHFVLKPDSSTTKLRVVFDASCKTTSNLSLNDIMLTGPTVQSELFDLLINFRTFRYVFTADIAQMYRQIWIDEQDRNLQLIIWRSKQTDKIRYYRLNTVTYGTKAAPYLATRCLKQLAEEEAIRYPLGSAAIEDFYVDDVITGSNSLSQAIKIRDELTKLLHAGGFQLRKWAANSEKLLQGIPRNELEQEKCFQEENSGYVKTLGLAWQPANDLFTFTTTWPSTDQITKRSVVSEMSRLFDPLGLVNPVIVAAKIFVQKIWKLKLDWDDSLPDDLIVEWTKFRESLRTLHHLKISRYMFTSGTPIRHELHAFADASEKAYGAAIYLRMISCDQEISCKLLCAKSRVAPVKVVTLPRLELCAAKLAANLAHRLLSTMKIKIDESYLWTDSQIVLSWIKGDPSTLKTFVAHRVASIQERTNPESWNYINTKSNPADLVSRGCTSEALINSELWFHGPSFLKKPQSEWPDRSISTVRLREEEKASVALITNTESLTEKSDHPLDRINHKNSFSFLQRSMAYILRGIRRMRRQITAVECAKWLSTAELNEALIAIIKEIQRRHFEEEIKLLQKNNNVKGSSRIASLTPFLDSNGVIRVGGRLDYAAISYDAKHPMLLPGTDFVSKLILNNLHKTHLHAGPLALLAIARQRFWILQARALARSTVSNCVECVRAKPQMLNQQMGNLPSHRVLPARPFLKTGVDFCGPILTHYHVRGKKPQKTYIAVYCCFTTKAIHMEVVSDLSTEGFIGSLRRFIARRGICEEIFCDNATNFVGARNKLDELREIMSKQDTQEQITRTCSEKGIQFNFAPPRSPHFGGLWEAAVKAAKKLLQQTLAKAALSYEELCTVVAEAEAILNSRPLTPLSTDPNDYTALTPGHFLVGEPLTSIPNSVQHTKNLTSLTRWKLVSAIRQEFWDRWVREYLCELQQRHKWKEVSPNVLPGMMVLMKEDNIPSLKWPMGRIIEAIPGKDGLVRVVVVKTPKGVYKRAIHNLALLPIEGGLSGQQPESTRAELKRVAKADSEGNAPTEDKQSSSRKRARFSLSTMLLSILAFFFLPLSVLGASSTEPFEITPVTQNSGIYFEQLGQGQLIVNDWKLIVFYNMTNYWKTYESIQKGIHKMKMLSTRAVDSNYFNMILDQYQHQLTELQEGNQLLFEVAEHRQRRGLVNVVGNIANKLFGTLDDEYAAQMETTIKSVKNNANHLLDLIKNQTSIIEATTNIMKRSEEERNNQLIALQNEMDGLFSNINNFTEEMKQEKITRTFTLLSVFVSLVITEFQKMQNSIIDIITDIHHVELVELVHSFYHRRD